jgi:MFS transporter, ACS family, tartrate transporter
MDRDLERDAIRKTALRVVPLLAAALFSNFLDRVNLGFAAVTMNRDLGFTRATYGLAAGTFFIGYFLFEIPSNLIMRRVGARLWICRIMITWGLVSAATAFIGGAAGLVVLRFLLGLAEAGFAPGLVLYVSLFFPQHYRGRILAWIMIAQPIAAVIGAPVSALLLELDGTLGLKGWQWMFLLEAPPSILLGIVVLGMLPNSPAEARFLTTAERERLAAVIEADRTTVAGSGSSTIRQAFLNRRVILLTQPVQSDHRELHDIVLRQR